MDRVRVGTVGYLNALPLTSHLDRDRYEVIADHPRGVAARLAAGDVDVALVPVAAVLDDGDFPIVPGWCIGADGPVESVLICAETEPEAWTEVVLDGESRTSVVLARLLLARGPLAARVRDGLVVRTVAPGEGPALARGPVAAVVIGDAARALSDRLGVRLDLAALWKQWTGKPFVFAVWAGRPDLPAAVRDDLRAAGAAGIAAVAGRYTGADLHYLTRAIRYPFDEPALIGLRRFAALAHELGLLRREHVTFYAPEPGPRAPRRALVDALERAAEGAEVDADTIVGWLRELSSAELANAAWLRRIALHGADRVTYLVADQLGADLVAAGGQPFDAALADAVAADATAVVLHGLGALSVSEAADRVARARAVGLQVEGAPGEPGLAALDAAASDEAIAAALVALRAAGAPGVVVALALPEGALVEPGRATTARWSRVVSVARLALTAGHVVASPRWLGLQACQAAVVSGADDLGVVGAWHGARPVAPGGQLHDAPVDEAERLLRETGLHPVRRDVRFREVGGPLTRPRKVRRMEERAS